MDELLLRQLVRQMKVLNFWITVFGSLFLIALIVAGVLLYKLVTFVHSTEQRLESIQQKSTNALNLQEQVCGNNRFTTLLDKSDKLSDYCK